MKLSRADILAGKDRTKDVFIEALQGEVTIRPLTDGEWSQVEAKQSEGLRVIGSGSQYQDMQLSVDIQQISQAEHEANFLAVAFGLSVKGEKAWDVGTVKDISPPAAVKQIAQEVYKLSGVDPGVEKLVNSFRSQPGGAAGDPVDAGGVPAGADTERPDTLAG